MEGADTDDTADRDWVRPGLVICTLLVVVATAFLMPAFATDGLAGSPVDRILPGESPTESAAGGSGAGGGLGALNPGDTTGVGGEVGLDGETYGNLDTELHFTVEADTGTYWRTGAYDHYTGSGWERTGSEEPLDGAIEHDGQHGEQIDYEIELAQTATAVPTAWRPSTVEADEELQVTDAGAVRADQPIEAGETIEGVSHEPERDLGTLRAAGENYPTEIEERYTQLPDDTPDRLVEFTDDLTADEDNPYDTAETIETWLKESKEYDLGVSRQSDTIADTFVFEMDAGYCEYFATAMVSMLRSQDIPARYVVGYSTGQPTGDGSYEVRAMNAHAWVEVYFEDVGWVRFDPTPGDERLSAQEEALSEIGEEYNIEEIGSPGDSFSPDEETEAPEEDGIQTELNQTAIPGEPVEVTVRYNEIPLEDVGVSFNGESVGRTDDDGTVVGTVPDAEELRITVQEPDTERAESEQTGLALSDAGDTASTSPGAGATVISTTDMQEEEETYPIQREATIAVGDNPAPGQAVTVTASAGDQLLDDATVTLDGTVVGETNEDGQLDVTLPEESGEISISVERGPVTGETVVNVPELQLDIDSGPLPAMAYGTVTAKATLDDEPAAGVPIEIDGEEVATTGADGTATARLPLDTDAAVTITADGQSQRVELSGLLWRFIVSLSVLGLVILSPLYALTRRGYGPRRLVASLSSLLAKTAHIVRMTLVGLARGELGPQEIRTACRGWLAEKRSRIGSEIDRIRHTEAAPQEEPNQMTVQEAWDRFIIQLSINTVETRTPGELARHAIEADELPEEPVVALRDTFREVEYGRRSPTDRLQQVEQAVREIEEQ